MLRFNISLSDSSQTKYTELKLDNLYIARDGSFISGTTPSINHLQDEKSIIIEYEDGETISYPITCEEVVRKGYVTEEVTYKIGTFQDKDGNSFKGCLYDDGMVYAVFKDEEGEEVKEYINLKPNYTDDKKEYENHYINNNEFKLDKKYYLDNDEIVISGFSYPIDVEYERKCGPNGGVTTCTETPDVTFFFDKTATTFKNWDTFHPYSFNEVEKLTKVIIHKNDDYELDIDSVVCTEPWYYINYEQKVSTNSFDQVTQVEPTRLYLNKLGYVDFDNEDDNTKGLGIRIYNENCEEYEDYKAKESAVTIDIGDDSYPIYKEWRNCGYSDKYLNIYTNNKTVHFFKGQEIYAVCDNNTNNEYSVIHYKENEEDDGYDYVVFNGIRYVIDDNNKRYYVSVGDDTELYELIFIKTIGEEEKKDIYFFEKDDKRMTVLVEDETVKYYNPSTNFFNNTTSSLVLHEFKYIEVNGVKYNVLERENLIVTATTEGGLSATTEEYVVIDEKIVERLIIDEVTANNNIRCVPYYEDTSVFRIYSDYKNYTFFLDNKLYDVDNIGKEVYSNKLRFFKNVSYFTFPIKVRTETANNMFQDIIVNRDFGDYQKNLVVNRIVDMEKDMYHPYYKKGSVIKPLNELRFYLHFRTRDLSTWKIDEDKNWNITDNYSNLPTFGEGKGYPDGVNPSDLLYYLNFTDDDVYYQKTKIKKSFLRLLFYDSNDPKTQNLLATSTIFMDSSTLYKKYCLNSDPSLTDDRGFIIMTDSIKGKYNEYSGVDKEPCSTPSEAMDYNEDERLDATISVKNMYDSSSSEGFYLYLFKEYSQELHERTIYLKIQFNHAGTGKVINFMQISKDVTNSKGNIHNMYTTLSTFYDDLFIPIKVKYDLSEKKFIYIIEGGNGDRKLDVSEENNVAYFNLFEIKFKDESEQP